MLFGAYLAQNQIFLTTIYKPVIVSTSFPKTLTLKKQKEEKLSMPEIRGEGQKGMRLITAQKPQTNICCQIAEELIEENGVKPVAKAKHLLRTMEQGMFYLEPNEISEIEFNGKKAKIMQNDDGSKMIVPWHHQVPKQKITEV